MRSDCVVHHVVVADVDSDLWLWRVLTSHAYPDTGSGQFLVGDGERVSFEVSDSLMVLSRAGSV